MRSFMVLEAMRRQVRVVQTVQKTVEILILQRQFIDGDIDRPVIMQRDKFLQFKRCRTS